MRYRFTYAQAWSFGGDLHAVDEADALPRIVREQEVAVEVDVVAQAGDLTAGRDAEARLEHAAEHDAQAERPRSVRDPHRLADAAALGELDVHAVGALRCLGD